MAEKDAITKLYMGKNDVFADMFNCCFFDGKRVVLPENLTSRDTSYSEYFGEDAASKPPLAVQRTRDLFKECIIKSDNERMYLLLGIENQTAVDRIMPVRVLFYDALCYIDQAEKRFTVGDEKRLVPILTLVVYWGEKPWNGPKSLKEMFGTELNESICGQYLPDWRMHIADMRRLEETADTSGMTSPLPAVIRAMNLSEDSERLAEAFINEPLLRILEHDTVMLLDCILRLGLKEYKTEHPEAEEGEVMNMPTFAEYLKGKGRLEGRLEGILEGRTEGRTEGRREGRLEGRTEGAANVIKALEELNYPKSDIEKIIAKSRQIEIAQDKAER